MSIWKDRRVLVTGATGLLGSHLVDQLVMGGASLTAIIRDYTPTARYYLRHKYRKQTEALGDITDFDFINRVINEYQIQTVFHLAAQTQVRVANINPIPTFKSNIEGTWNVLEACRINGVGEVLVASSDKAYGYNKEPYKEDSPLNGRHPYDVSKVCADVLAQTYANTYHMNIGITRCGNLFGPGDLNFDRLIPGTIRSFLERKPVTIRSDGTMIRDYFYVKDAVFAYLKLAYAMIQGHSRRIYNFSYGEKRSVIDVVNDIGDLMGYKKYEILGTATNEITEQLLDSSIAKTYLGWKPGWSWTEALEETIKWYKENLK